MSGHSKWSKIKRQKEVNDREKSTIFAKLSRAITIAVVEGGGVGDPNHNIKLRLAVEKARDMNMPKENISRAIEKASLADSSQLKTITYEAFAPHGVTLIIIASTQNSNRTTSQVKNILERNHAKLGNPGSVVYLFQEVVRIAYELNPHNEEALLQLADHLSATDFETEEGVMVVDLPLSQINNPLLSSTDFIRLAGPEVVWKPQAPVHLSDAQNGELLRLITALESYEDVQEVHSNILN